MKPAAKEMKSVRSGDFSYCSVCVIKTMKLGWAEHIAWIKLSEK
jgi:hypothetical protein